MDSRAVVLIRLALYIHLQRGEQLGIYSQPRASELLLEVTLVNSLQRTKAASASVGAPILLTFDHLVDERNSVSACQPCDLT